TGADLEAVCREAAMIALRESLREGNVKPQPVAMKHFLQALKTVRPSLRPEDIRRYERLASELKRMVV
ncbi:MAG: hypothetical protein ABWW69_04925, partial [Pyrodictiaceae archaeon]